MSGMLKDLLISIWFVIVIFLFWLAIFFLKVLAMPGQLFEAGKTHAKRSER